MPAEIQHEWQQILNRRWCLCCNLDQYRKRESEDWHPPVAVICARDTNYARRLDRQDAIRP